MENENVTLKGKLDDIEKNDELINNSTNKTSVGEELKVVEELTYNFDCIICGKTFETRSILKMHERKIHEVVVWKSKLLAMETEVSRLKSCLFSDLYSLKEIKIRKQQTCSCKGFCVITHSKHNWVQLSSEKIMKNLKKVGVQQYMKLRVMIKTSMDVNLALRNFQKQLIS